MRRPHNTYTCMNLPKWSECPGEGFKSLGAGVIMVIEKTEPRSITQWREARSTRSYGKPA
jgi:hypothetical protein